MTDDGEDRLIAWSVRAVALGRAGDRDVIVSGSTDGSVRVWDMATGHPLLARVSGHTGTVYAVALGRVGDRDVIVSGGEDATVRLWDPHTAAETLIQDTIDPVRAVALTDNLLTFSTGTALCAITLT